MQEPTDELKEKLNNYGYKLTPQRKAILEVLSQHRGEHLSSEEIFTLVSKTYSGIGLATIYRTLPILEKMDLVKNLFLADGFVRYEINDAGESHSHHHLICTGCGSIAEFREDMLENLEREIAKNSKFVIKNHSVKFYGLCEKCAR